MIQIVGEEENDSIRVKSSSARISRSWRGSAFRTVYPSSSPWDTLFLFANDVLILTKVFKSDVVPDPVAQLGNIKDSTATVSEILQNPALTVVLPDCFYDHSFYIFSFEARVIQNNDTIILLQSFEPGSIDTVFNIDSETGEITLKTRIRDTTETIIETRGNTLVEHHIESIRSMAPGEKLFIENIKARCPDCASLRRLAPVVITIE